MQETQTECGQVELRHLRTVEDMMLRTENMKEEMEIESVQSNNDEYGQNFYRRTDERISKQIR
jgi:hypothetical protein